MDCPKCGDNLYELPISSEAQGIRNDQFCCDCNTRFGLSKSGLFIISEPANTSAIAAENAELKITIRNMLKIKEE